MREYLRHNLLQQQIVVAQELKNYKESLKDKIEKANAELKSVAFEYKQINEDLDLIYEY